MNDAKFSQNATTFCVSGIHEEQHQQSVPDKLNPICLRLTFSWMWWLAHTKERNHNSHKINKHRSEKRHLTIEFQVAEIKSSKEYFLASMQEKGLFSFFKHTSRTISPILSFWILLCFLLLAYTKKKTSPLHRI